MTLVIRGSLLLTALAALAYLLAGRQVADLQRTPLVRHGQPPAVKHPVPAEPLPVPVPEPLPDPAPVPVPVPRPDVRPKPKKPKKVVPTRPAPVQEETEDRCRYWLFRDRDCWR